MPRKLTILTIALIMAATGALLVVGCGGSNSTGTVTATTMEVPVLDSGPISGEMESGVWTYKGIPYAAPPVDELRWREPQPVTPWEEVLPCTEYGPACPQPESDFGGLMETGVTDEDCLYLNIWTPAESPDERLPVMFWIHGGAFTTGSGSLQIYDGHNLAQKDVVVVTINYRLGPLGFMAHPLLSAESPYGVSGNYGLLDQVAALEWVQENIDVFGGDPGLVTVFGESAGGMSICDLMASPLASGLFHRAIIESGPMLELGLPIFKSKSLDQAEQAGEELSAALGCDRADDELAALREKTPEELLSAPKPLSMLVNPISMGPCIDGWFLPDYPSSIFAAGEQQDVPLIVGTNADEGTIFTPQIPQALYWSTLVLMYGDNAEEVYELYPAENQEQVESALDSIVTEMGFASSARFTAASMEDTGSPAYLYEFTKLSEDPRAEGLGSFHGLEIVYVFGNLDMAQAEGIDEEDRSLSRAIMDYWTNFARTGDPNTSGLPQWPAYSSQSDEYQELGDTVTTRSGYYPQAYDLVMKISGQYR